MNTRKNKIIKAIMICVAIIIVLVCGIFIALPRILFNGFFKDIPTETDCVPTYVLSGTLYAKSNNIHISQICRKVNKNHSLKEVFCITNERVYFVYSAPRASTRNWIIAFIDLNTLQITPLCEFLDAEETYKSDRTAKYADRNGYYYNGQIILNDHVTVLVYDISSNSSRCYNYCEYTFPQRTVYGEYVDVHTVKLNTEAGTRTYTLQEMATTSTSIEKLYTLRDKTTWNGTSCLAGFFSQASIQEVEGKIYAIGSCLNFSGESYAIILEYDTERDSWLYVSKCFSNDIVHGNCYIIPNGGDKGMVCANPNEKLR